jgi:hypothetical protein
MIGSAGESDRSHAFEYRTTSKSVYNINAKSWIVPSEVVGDVEHGKEKVVQYTKTYIRKAGREPPRLIWKKSRSR